MFNFQKEVIINSNTLEDGTPRFMAYLGVEGGDSLAPKSPVFRVLRCADYAKAGLVDNVVWKTVGTYGTLGSVSFTKPTDAGLYRVFIGVSLEAKYLADYAMPWYRFSKPITAEFTLTEENKTDAQDIMYKALVLAIPDNYKFVTVAKESTDKVKITCTDTHQTIKVAKLQKAEKPDCPDTCSEVDYVDVQTPSITKNEVEFATGTWLQENLRFPSYPNLRYKALNSEEYPIPSALYHQYTFQYCSPRRGLGGLSTVGQQLTSVTTHTFYVLESLASEFEAALAGAFGNVINSVDHKDYEVTVTNDGTITTSTLTGESTSTVVIQTTVNDGELVTDAKFISYQLVDANGKYGIKAQSDGSCKVFTLEGKTAAANDKFTIIANYRGSFGKKEFTVTAS